MRDPLEMALTPQAAVTGLLMGLLALVVRHFDKKGS